MFSDQSDDHQSQSNTDMDQVVEDISTTPSFGLGVNPSSFNPVLPGQSNDPTPPTTSVPVSNISSPMSSPSVSTSAPSGLDEIKTQALQQLSPLVDKLDQAPEERYKTLMMLIQASDNHELIQDAYAAANAISDETMRAEALLGVVNEINYFTAKQNQ